MKPDFVLRAIPFIILTMLAVFIIFIQGLAPKVLLFGTFLAIIGLYLTTKTKSSIPMHLTGAGMVLMAIGGALALAGIA